MHGTPVITVVREQNGHYAALIHETGEIRAGYEVLAHLLRSLAYHEKHGKLR